LDKKTDTRKTGLSKTSLSKTGLRKIGSHLRLDDSYSDMPEQAIALGADACQFFFIAQGANRYLKLTKEDKERFLELRKQVDVFAHSSYWINPATGKLVSREVSEKLLARELKIAHALDIDYLVMHAGSAKEYGRNLPEEKVRRLGIQATAKLLTNGLKKEKQATVLVENTAHGGKTVCSDLNDFTTLRAHLDPALPIGFCVDTAHAFAYGYDLEDTESFLALLDTTMGLENIKLIHLNDSLKPCGSKIDMHTIPGKGLIGQEALLRFATHPALQHLPIIIEPPVLPPGEVKAMIEKLRYEIKSS